MKYIATLFTIILFSQMTQSQQNSESYENLWKKVQKLEDQALTKSALTLVQSISEKAKKENNSAQLIKALLYSSKYAMTLEEDSQLKIIGDFKTEVEKAEFPTKNILESYLANMYWQYYQQNRYKFYDRTKTTTKANNTDFRTWDLTTLFEEISSLFDKSLANPKALQELDTSSFQDILNAQPSSETYRPTLFDILAHTALQFYKTSENNITRPADKFEIDAREILCGAYEFTQLKISTVDSTSLQVKALLIYQQLLQFHYPDAQMYALVEVDIERLKYIHENAVFENKDQLYLEVLQQSAQSLSHSEVSALYNYEIAALYRQWGNSYTPNVNDEHQWKQKEALELCEEIIAKFPESRGAKKCSALKFDIFKKSLELTTEQHVPVNTPSRLLVDYKNHNGLQLTAYAISQNELQHLNTLYPEPEKLAYIKKLNTIKEWRTDLKNEKDYQSHKTEVSIPSLPNGQYVILAIPEEDGDSAFAYSPIQVTDLALIETRTPVHHKFQVINRINGSPVHGAKVKFNYRKNYNGPDLTNTFTTNEMGMVEILLDNDYWTNVKTEITHRSDKAYFGDYYVNQKHDNNTPSTIYTSFLFTDRSIYRPGQPLYFKGIAIKKDKNTSSVLTNTTVAVTLYDVNRQEVDKQEFITNEFGSFNGEFLLPSAGLTGNFSMEVTSKMVNLHGNANFSVEEYKRPKFETSFEPVTETYKVNDSISLNGKAIAYAGSNITDAKVSYRVRRVTNFPRWYYWGRPHHNGTPQEIAHGETVTDASGNYSIKFKAIPDTSLDRETQPTFNYEITADVTDINGETHSATTTVRAGYHVLTANIGVANTLDKDKSDIKITISTNNLNGQFVATKGTLKMYKLKGPEEVLRSRPWPAPDYKGFSRAEFEKRYPHDAFENEHDPTTWEKGKLVWETKFDTKQSQEVILNNTKKWPSGNYVIELETEDKFGQKVKDVAHTRLFSNKDKKLADHQLFQIKTDKQTYNIGDKVEVTLSSSAENLTVSVFVEKNQKIVDTRTVLLNGDSKTFDIPVNTDDLGGFAINYSFSAFNSFESGTVPVLVPYPPTDLKIESITFRDKLLPGTDETWTFKIKGPKGEQVTSEVLASMYDASLDAFRGHNWSFDPNYRSNYYSSIYSNANQSYGTSSFLTYSNYKTAYNYELQSFDSFNWFGFHFGYGRQRLYSNMAMRKGAPSAAMGMMAPESESLDEVVTTDYDVSEKKEEGPFDKEMENDKNAATDQKVQIRKNLQETAFFFPQLHTDPEGNVSFSFTTPEALTRWKLQLLAHTKTLQYALTTLETVTQKELMVIPNIPRFLREGDEIVISTKIANLTKNVLSGASSLKLTDVVTGNDVTEKLIVPFSSEEMARKSFSVDSLGNTQVSWRLKIPEGLQGVQYTITAKAGSFSDGEQSILPVLTNRMLVTETLPMWVRSNQTKTFILEKLLDNTSTTLSNHKLTLELTSNPAWYAVQALPYLMEYPYDCNEQIFSRYYANTLASHIANSNPRIREVFDQWSNSKALLSGLEKNQELKSMLIEETPWLRDAQSETEQKKRIALLFDLNKMRNEQRNALNKLKENQMSSGAWAWFNGGRENRFITQHIITGLGHLKQLNVTDANDQTEQMIERALQFLDKEFVEEYNRMKKRTSNINDDHLSHTQTHYLYMRSFFKDIPKSSDVVNAIAYYKSQAQKYWPKKNLYTKGLLALSLNRMGDNNTSKKIVRSLKENSINSEELGMYWKENTNSWFWYQAPVETQALMIEVFSELTDDSSSIDNLKIWLLQQKKTNQWKTTKASSDAVYALLLQGGDWLSVNDAVNVEVGGKKIDPSKLENVKVEAGTGYFKTTWNGNEISNEMAWVQLDKKGEGIAWGALYWQYFEDLDKITSEETPLQLEKKLFLKRNTDTGEEIWEITSQTTLEVGDLVRIRIELRVDRAMEFVHMKDMRAAGTEPINVLSQYKRQDGLGYYESTKDASTNFFFDYLTKGVYVFEYDLRVNNSGDFSNGITTIQSMYAPEYSSHSEGVRLQIK
ncbi:alpha-2-macroglobulin family protein [Kriegella aquimaris]|uniref:Alpha-2-macroglobulin family N-terminal region n=1 Tax=Kriegella aquimaris TaxID=192904 RepID=A0A1G9VU23_9FLAO|nr:MG2 domain-containing protein [Kriegella aquimaris]SDM75516.1 Alpha-2-macroglobulin family N-terminal region [Kriegella aquimaris]